MSRHRLPTGAHGAVRYRTLPSGLVQVRTRVGTDAGVREVSATGQSKGAARRALERRLATYDAPQPVTPAAPSERLLRWWVEDFLTHAPVRPQTVSVYRRSLVCVPDALWTMTPSSITPMDLAAVMENSTTPVNTKQALIVIRQALDRAVLARVIDQNPARIVPTRPRQPRRPVRALTPNEETQLLTRINTWANARGKHSGDPSRLRDIVVVALATGGRIGEVLALRGKDLTQITKRPLAVSVHVTGTVVEDHGIHRQEYTKTEAGLRTLIVGGPAAVALLARKAKTGDASPLFPSRTGRWGSPSNTRRALRTALAGSRLAWVTPHTLRRTLGTRVAQQSGVLTAAEALGHADTRTVSRYVERRRTVNLTNS